MHFSSRLRSLASETAIYGISTIVGRVINFLLVPLYVAYFAPDDYGVVMVVYAFFTLANHLYQHGMESAYLKFASGKEGRARVDDVLSTGIWSVLIASIVLSALILVAREPLGRLIGIAPEQTHLFTYVIAIQALDCLAIVPFAELRLQNRAKLFASLKMTNIGLNVGLNLVLIVGYGNGIESVFVSNVVASAVTFLLLIPVLRGRFHFRIDRALWRQLVLFGLPFVPSGLSYAMVDRVNVIFVNNMDAERVRALYETRFDLSELVGAGDAAFGQYMAGIFGAIWKLGVFMMLVAQMFRFAWQPFFLQHADDPDARPLFARVFSLFTAVSLLVVLSVAFYIDDLVALPMPGGRPLIPERYWPALYIVPIALLAYLFQGWYYNFTAGAYIEKKTRYFVYCTFAGGAVALIGQALLVPTYGMTAAAWVTTGAYAVMAILLFFFVHQFYPVPYDWPRVLAMVALAGGLYLLWNALPLFQHWWVETALLAAFVAGIVGLRVISIQALRQLMPNR